MNIRPLTPEQISKKTGKFQKIRITLMALFTSVFLGLIYAGITFKLKTGLEAGIPFEVFSFDTFLLVLITAIVTLLIPFIYWMLMGRMISDHSPILNSQIVMLSQKLESPEARAYIDEALSLDRDLTRYDFYNLLEIDTAFKHANFKAETNEELQKRLDEARVAVYGKEGGSNA